MEAKRREFINNLKKGDIIYTSSGIIGKVHDITDRTVLLEVSPEVRIRILKDTIQGPYVEKVAQEKRKEGKGQGR